MKNNDIKLGVENLSRGDKTMVVDDIGHNINMSDKKIIKWRQIRKVIGDHSDSSTIVKMNQFHQSP